MALAPVTVARHLSISGRVQGVGFRYYFQRTARDLGITGWVRNRADGSVEATVCGTTEMLDTIVAWARQGPPAAAVSAVEVKDISATAERFSGFETLPDA